MTVSAIPALLWQDGSQRQENGQKLTYVAQQRKQETLLQKTNKTKQMEEDKQLLEGCRQTSTWTPALVCTLVHTQSTTTTTNL